MKKFSLLKVTVLVAFVCSFQACDKPKDVCRTCTARYNGSTVATKNACSAQDEADFKTEYYYATVSCN